MNDDLVQHKESFDLAVMRLQHLQERVQSQLQFGAMLCEFHPQEAGGWRKLLARASARAADGFAKGDLARTAASVEAAEKLLGPLAEVAKSYTIYCVGHGHIDMNWMWSWPETVAVTNDTFTTVIRLMDEFPQFKFSQSQASVYAILEEHNPELLARIAERVREGRWEVTASHWVENDNNMAGPEALCRHLLYTREYMRQLFGLSPEDIPIGWSADTFGHAATLPTYLVRGGVKYLYLHRPGGVGPARPGMFWWRGPDGSRVLVRNDMMVGYNGVVRPNDLLTQLRLFTSQTGIRALMYVYGVGDHGGGPTRRDILRGLDMNGWPIFPNVQFSTSRAFYERVEREAGRLPTLDCELNFEFTGCYTSQSLIKRDNRFAENHLVDAEAAASLAWQGLGRPYPADRLRGAWRDTLFSHFHDILPGSGIHDTRTYADGLYQKTMATTEMIETLALRNFAGRVNTAWAAGPEPLDVPPSHLSNALGAGPGYLSANGAISQAEQSSGEGSRPVVLFNPLPWERSEVVEATVWDNSPMPARIAWKNRAFSVRSADGKTIAPQVIEGGAFWGHDFVRLAFPAQVPALGYNSFAVSPEPGMAAQPVPSGGGVWLMGDRLPRARGYVERTTEGLENDLVRVDLDVQTGGIRSFVDKRSGAMLISADRPAPVLEYAVERLHDMTAWVIGNTGPVEYARVVSLKRKLAGPYKASMEARLKIHESDLTLTYELRAGDPQLYIHLEVAWFQRGSPEVGVPALRMVFPLALTEARGRYEIPFGAVDRALSGGEEVPALQWAQVTGRTPEGQAGCLLINDSKYGYSLAESTLHLTLIRSSYDPDPLPEIRNHEIHVALRPFGGDLPVAEAIRAGRDFNHAIRVIGTDVHDGPFPVWASLIRTLPASLILTSVKKAEGDDALVLTFFDPSGGGGMAAAGFDAQILGRPTGAVEVDLMERPVADSSAAYHEDTATVHVPPHGIASMKVTLAR